MLAGNLGGREATPRTSSARILNGFPLPSGSPRGSAETQGDASCTLAAHRSLLEPQPAVPTVPMASRPPTSRSPASAPPLGALLPMPHPSMLSQGLGTPASCCCNHVPLGGPGLSRAAVSGSPVSSLPPGQRVCGGRAVPPGATLDQGLCSLQPLSRPGLSQGLPPPPPVPTSCWHSQRLCQPAAQTHLSTCVPL